eukprot:gene47-4297_t
MTQKTGKNKKITLSSGSSHITGIVTELVGIRINPNVSVKKCVRVRVYKTGQEILARVPNDGGLTFITVNDNVTLEGAGRNGKSFKELPNVKYKVIKIGGKSMDFLLHP